MFGREIELPVHVAIGVGTGADRLVLRGRVGHRQELYARPRSPASRETDVVYVRAEHGPNQAHLREAYPRATLGVRRVDGASSDASSASDSSSTIRSGCVSSACATASNAMRTDGD